MIDLEKLKRLSRQCDDMAKGKSVPEVIEFLGADMAAIVHVAQQRAMRALMVSIADLAKKSENDKGETVYSIDQNAVLAAMAACWTDGFTIGTMAQKEQQVETAKSPFE